MKTQKEFRLPITPGIRQILEEQKVWRDSAEGCNKDYVFLQPRDPLQPFSSAPGQANKIYSPENAVKGIRHDGTVKGKEGALYNVPKIPEE